MKRKIPTIFAAMFILILAFSMVACGKKSGNSLTGTWEYNEDGIKAVYVFEEGGTGTYTMDTGESVTYKMKYETKDNHLLVSYVDNDVFDETDVFDSEYTLKDDNTLIIKDSFGTEMTFVKK